MYPFAWKSPTDDDLSYQTYPVSMRLGIIELENSESENRRYSAP
jgi:hypothetical protein